MPFCYSERALARVSTVRPHAADPHTSFLADFLGNRAIAFPMPPARIAEAHLRNAGPDAELKLVVHSQRPPTLDAVRVGRWPAQRFDLRMAVENAVGDAVDPVSAVADFAIGR